MLWRVLHLICSSAGGQLGSLHQRAQQRGSRRHLGSEPDRPRAARRFLAIPDKSNK
eukprot:COSAG02_NODE_6530_length_3516_cov_1.974246_6_plen_56_part_00